MIERQLVKDIVVRTGYAGSKGTHLGINTDLNAGIRGVRPNPDFDKIIQNISGANSIYNSFIAAVDKRFSKGFSLGANYTWSKSLDWASNLSDLDTINVVNPYNLRAYRAVSRLRRAAPVRTELRLADAVTGLWRIAAHPWGLANQRHLELAAGFPLSVTSGVDNSGSFTGNDLADLISTPSLTSGSRGEKIRKWFSTEAFRVNAPGTYGTSGRNILRGPGRFNIDFSAAKSFPFGRMSGCNIVWNCSMRSTIQA